MPNNKVREANAVIETESTAQLLLPQHRVEVFAIEVVPVDFVPDIDQAPPHPFGRGVIQALLSWVTDDYHYVHGLAVR